MAKAPKHAPLSADAALERLRALAFGLPAVEEKLSHGAPSFFVRGKMFATFADDHHGDGRTAAWCKAETERQQALVHARPDRYFVPPYVGVKGWVGVGLGAATDWEELALILEQGWSSVAPKSAREAPVLPPPKAAPLKRTDPEVARAAFERIEAMCAALPGSECEREKWSATFRVAKKPYLYFQDNHHGDGVIGAWVRGDKNESAALVSRHPERYFIPAYLGPRGWLGLRLDATKVDWKDIATRVSASHASVTTAGSRRPRRG